MPNWCSNSLSVTGETKEEVQEFVEKVKGKDEQGNELVFSFSSLVPKPETEDDWYHWRVENWGTKWDVGNDCNISNEGDAFYVSFDTAWSPPIEWLQKVATMFPNLTFRLTYFEPGMAFAGDMDCSEGYSSNNYYNSDDEEYWYIATDGMSDLEVEQRAKENIEQNAFDYWNYSFEDLVEYVGEENKEKLENLLLVKKLVGDLQNSSSTEFNGADIEDIIEELIEKEVFYEKIFKHRQQMGTLRQLAV